MSDQEVLNTKERLNKSLHETISQYGWTSVSMPEGRKQPPWSYSIGLFETYKVPEVVVMGKERALMSAMLTNIHEAVKTGQTLSDGLELSNVWIDNNCVFRTVEQKHYTKYLPWAVDYYGHQDFPVLQLIWPDPFGYFPWQEGFDTRLGRFQQMLFST